LGDYIRSLELAAWVPEVLEALGQGGCVYRVPDRH
jgi:hypothetical protein